MKPALGKRKLEADNSCDTSVRKLSRKHARAWAVVMSGRLLRVSKLGTRDGPACRSAHSWNFGQRLRSITSSSR